MRLIGIKFISGDTLIRKTLKDNTWYPFGNYYEPTEANMWEWRSEEQKAHEEVSRQMYKTVVEKDDITDSLDITINCIVGKNGSGKSSLLDIFYRIINNFSWKLIDQMWVDNTVDRNPQRGHQLEEACGFDAILYYETDGCVGSIHYCYGNIQMNYHTDAADAAIRGENFTKLATKTHMEKLTRHFFYTICTNYSIHSLNQRDYTPNKLWIDHNNNVNGKWLHGLFHKNDGYVTPIVMVPYRTEDDYIDINNENDLAKQRLATLAILWGSQNRLFMNRYKPSELVYRFDNDAAERYNLKFNKLFKERLPLNKNCSAVKQELKKQWRSYLRNCYTTNYRRMKREVRDAVLSYLVYKTLKNCIQYRYYGIKLGMRCLTKEEANRLKKNCYGLFLEYQPVKIADVLETILYKDKNIHINLKIHQLLCYVDLNHYTTQYLVGHNVDNNIIKSVEYGWSTMPVEKLYKYKKNENGKSSHAFRTYDEVSKLMPPAIFEWDINFTTMHKGTPSEKETLTLLSSGEKQFMHSISYIIYHLKNLQSVTDGDYRIRYHNVCLVFDEAELYYHPEFQRTFISNLIEMLSWCHINPNIIRGINILIVTHSPFVLSDVPLSNTLYLKEGIPVKIEKETFCANIHELLGENFFIDYSIGDVARKNVEDIIKLYNQRNVVETGEENKKLFLAEKKRLQYVASLVADEYLKRTVKKMMNEMSNMYEDKLSLDDRIEILQKELDSLKMQKNIEENDKGELQCK